MYEYNIIHLNELLWNRIICYHIDVPVITPNIYRRHRNEKEEENIEVEAIYKRKKQQTMTFRCILASACVCCLCTITHFKVWKKRQKKYLSYWIKIKRNNIVTMNLSILINLVISIGSYRLTKTLIPSLSDMFVRANLHGTDLSKSNRPRMWAIALIQYFSVRL